MPTLKVKILIISTYLSMFKFCLLMCLLGFQSWSWIKPFPRITRADRRIENVYIGGI